MASSSPGKNQTILAVIALLGALASIITALLGSDGVSSLLPFTSDAQETATDSDNPAAATDPPGIYQRVDGSGQGCVVGNVGPNSTVTCESSPQSPVIPAFPNQPRSLVPPDLNPGQPTLPDFPEGFGSFDNFPPVPNLDTTAPRSWCLGMKEQWSARNDSGRDSASIRASFDEGNCASHGLSIP